MIGHSHTVLTHCFSLLAPTTATPNEAAFTRLCVAGYLVPRLLRRHFSEAAQISAAQHISHLLSVRLRKRGSQPQAQSQLQSQLRGLGRGLRAVGSSGKLEEPSVEGNEESGSAVSSGGSGSGGGDDQTYLIGCLDVLTQLIRWLDSCIGEWPLLHLKMYFHVLCCSPFLTVKPVNQGP